MPTFKLIHAVELDEFTAALKRYGWQEEDFSVAEEEYDPATAEIEAATGEVIITCTLAHRVGVYYLGRGSYWVTDFVDDLRAGSSASRRVRQAHDRCGRCVRAHGLRGERQCDRFGNHFRRCVEDTLSTHPGGLLSTTGARQLRMAAVAQRV